MKIWADPETDLPYLIEYESESGAPCGTVSKIEFDVELDDALFSTEVPAGYQREEDVLKHRVPVHGFDEQKLVKALRLFSEASGGQFPDELTKATSREYMKALQANSKFDARKYADFIMGVSFTTRLPKTALAQYAGKGVLYEANEENKEPIFWYLREKAGPRPTWRVLGVDLEFRDADEPPIDAF